jgi:hypothetical protein
MHLLTQHQPTTAGRDRSAAQNPDRSGDPDAGRAERTQQVGTRQAPPPTNAGALVEQLDGNNRWDRETGRMIHGHYGADVDTALAAKFPTPPEQRGAATAAKMRGHRAGGLNDVRELTRVDADDDTEDAFAGQTSHLAATAGRGQSQR